MMALTAFIKPFEAPQRNMKISKSVDWFLYDNGLRHERVKSSLLPKTKNKQSKNFFPLFNDSKCFEGYLYKTTQHLSMRWKRET